MSRALLSPVIDACLEIAKDATNVTVGDGVAPKCDKPYAFVTAVTSRRYTGPFSDIEADSADRIQFSFVGTTRAQADSMRDAVRTFFTVAALDAEFVTQSTSRRTMTLTLDISPMTRKEDRGLPNPIFTAIDQYVIETTPTA